MVMSELAYRLEIVERLLVRSRVNVLDKQMTFHDTGDEDMLPELWEAEDELEKLLLLRRNCVRLVSIEAG